MVGNTLDDLVALLVGAKVLKEYRINHRTAGEEKIQPCPYGPTNVASMRPHVRGIMADWLEKGPA
jgi:hypothetical protein